MTWQQAYGASLGTAIALAPLCRAAALSMQLTNRPRPDRWGSLPTPLLGGPAILGAAAVTALIMPGRQERIPLLCGAGAALALGLMDDFRAMGPREKLLGLTAAWSVEQFVAACLRRYPDHSTPPASATPRHTVREPAPAALRHFRSLITCLVGANALNLVDNMDGVAASIAAVSASGALSLTGDGVIPASIAGSCLGYLACNSYPAGILMGDAGSLSLGYLVSRLAAEADSPAHSLLLLAVPAIDIAVLLAGRAIGRRSLVRGNTDHLTHSMARRGVSEPAPAAIFCLLQAAACVIGAKGSKSGETTGLARRITLFTGAAATGVMLGRRLSAYRAVSHRPSAPGNAGFREGR